MGGRIQCNDTKPTPEMCNGLDDDCNGSVDDGVFPPANMCNPPGLTAGMALQGECRPGRFLCTGVEGWVCTGGVGPSLEICDGKDNDCDGEIDNQADCGARAVCYEGQCVPLCGEVEQPCSADRYCKGGLCLVRACAFNPCPAGQMCDSVGRCYDPCAKVDCPLGATCRNGVCQDCYSQGCPSGQICHARTCQADPCAGVACDLGQYCSNGACLQSCTGLTCPKGQICRAGQCQVDACSGASCSAAAYCDPQTATCKNRPCSGISCLAGTVCVEVSGKCETDPCEVVHCQAQEECIVQPDGHPECELINSPYVAVAHVKPGSRGLFGCSVGGNAGGAGALALLLLGWVATRVRRRR